MTESFLGALTVTALGNEVATTFGAGAVGWARIFLVSLTTGNATGAVTFSVLFNF